MDFDEEMSSLQIEDLGEYFFPNDLANDNWKGFSLGYGDEEKPSAPPKNNQVNISKPIEIATAKNSSSSSRDRSGSLANSLGGGGISFGANHDANMLVSPPMLASSFSEMLKHSSAAAALGFGGATDFSMSPAGINQFNPMTATTPKTKDDELMELANFTLEGRFGRPSDKRPLAMQRPPLNPTAPSRPTLVTSSNAAATCNRIMDEDNDDDDDDDDDDDMAMVPAKRRLASSTSSTPTSSSTSSFGSKRSFDMVDSGHSSNACSTIGGNEDDRGFRKKSREKMRRQEVNVKFDELIDLLGLSNRVRKSAILQEAVSAIKSLKRERDEIRRDRDRLQQEVSKLATCLQYSHLGSVAAANAVAMSSGHGGGGGGGNTVQFPTAQQLSHANAAAQLAQLNLTQQQLASVQLPGGAAACFPIGGSFGGAATLAPAPSSSSSTSTAVANATPIAPKVLKPATDPRS